MFKLTLSDEGKHGAVVINELGISPIGDGVQVIGFTADLDRQEVDVLLAEAIADPSKITGMRPVYHFAGDIFTSYATVITAGPEGEQPVFPIHVDVVPDPVPASEHASAEQPATQAGES